MLDSPACALKAQHSILPMTPGLAWGTEQIHFRVGGIDESGSNCDRWIRLLSIA